MIGTFRAQSLYPMLQTILKKRQIQFLVPPFSAAMQVSRARHLSSLLWVELMNCRLRTST